MWPGLVDVADGKIPEKMPENGVSGEAGLRLSSGNLEKTDIRRYQCRTGQQLRAAYRRLIPQSGDYAVPRSKERRPSETTARQPCRFKTGSIGLSWVGDKGFLGVAYSDRRDRYGLPAHSHLYDDCHADIIWQKSLINKRYLQLYPHLLTEEMSITTIRALSCGFHDDNDAHAHAHNGKPWMDLRNKRYELRAEWEAAVPRF